MRLIAPGSIVGFLGELAVPADFYWVVREPVPLAGMAYPGRVDWGCSRAKASGTSCASPTTSRATTRRRSRAPRYGSTISTTGARPATRRPSASGCRSPSTCVSSTPRSRRRRRRALHGRSRPGRHGARRRTRLPRPRSRRRRRLPAPRAHVGRGRKDGWPESPWQAALVRTAKTTTPPDSHERR